MGLIRKQRAAGQPGKVPAARKELQYVRQQKILLFEIEREFL